MSGLCGSGFICSGCFKTIAGKQQRIDMKKNILDVAGLLEEDTDINSAFAEKIEAKIVDLETGDYVENINAMIRST